jgi:CubicO group peptidase (beta-lactamase class C family)
MKNKFWPSNSSEWTEVAPEEQGLDSNKIDEMFEFIEKNSYDVHSIIICRNGYLVKEAYLHNSTLLDTKSYPGGVKIHNQWSATKSVISILIGTALQEGFLDNINQTLYEFFADDWDSNFTDSEIKKNITIEQLLKMNAGFVAGKEAPKTKESFDLINWALAEVPIGFTPGQAGKFEYSNDGVNLLSGIITRVTGKSAEEFAQEYLFTPLGISNDEYYWWHDDEGNSAGGYGLSCTAKVQAKIGILCLNNGCWRGKQIVEPTYMAKSISTQTSFDSKGKDKRSGVSYGYLWVITENPFKGYYAAGSGGQCIFVIPDYNITIGITGAVGVEWFYEKMIADYILQFTKDE